MKRQSGTMAVGGTLCVLTGIAVAGSGLFGANVVQAADEPGAKASNDPRPSNEGLTEKQLREKVAKLEAEVARLQLRVKQLEQGHSLRVYTQPPGSVLPPGSAQRQGTTPPRGFIMPRVLTPRNQQVAPPGAEPFNFNGHTYYRVPLQKGQETARVPQTVAPPVITTVPSLVITPRNGTHYHKKQIKRQP